MYCDNCGNEISEDHKYCQKCGRPVFNKSNDWKEKLAENGGNESLSAGGLAEIFRKKKTLIIVATIALIGVSVFIISFVDAEISSSNQAISLQQPTSTSSVAGQTTSTLQLEAINPSVVLAPYQNVIAISGTGFQNAATVTAGKVELDISGQVTPDLVYVKYPGNFNAGRYDITITNPNGDSSTLDNALTIQEETQSSATQSPNVTTELTSAQIVQKVSPSVVLIRTDLGCGSGMIVSGDGTILTDNHVIEGAGYIDVYLNSGSMYSGSVIDQDSAQDLALVKIDDSGLPAVTFGNSNPSSLLLGADVTALGYPLTCLQDQTLEVDPGIVTARRTSDVLGADAIQTSARINPGDSGGPLVDDYGDVVGINESILTIEDLDLNVTGIAFATPSEVIQPFINNPSGYSSELTPTDTNVPSSYFSSSTPSSNTHQFQLNVNNVCTDDGGNGAILLSGYPYTSPFSIPPDDILQWADGDVAFVVPTTVPDGTYQVTVRGYEPGTGYCSDVNAGNITVQ